MKGQIMSETIDSASLLARAQELIDRARKAGAEAADAVKEGYLAHKFKARPWFDVFEAARLVSEATPPAYKIDIDWNGLLVNAGNAIPVLAELDKNPKVATYESPIPHEDIEGYQKIRKQIKNPLAIHFGGMPKDEARKNIHLFAETVLPELKSWQAEASIDDRFLEAAE